MKKHNIIKVASLVIVLVGAITVPITLYFTIGNKDTTTKVNLNDQTLTYLAKVQRMKVITEQEANKIKSDIQKQIQTKLDNLNLQENIDYSINNLETIKAGINLDGVHIIVNATPGTTKAKGSFTVTINVTENIDNRSIPIIQISRDEADELSEIRAKVIQNTIKLNVDDVLNEGQFNIIDKDYEIINLDLIKNGAKYNDYNTAISVRGISRNIEGSFKINFEIEG